MKKIEGVCLVDGCNEENRSMRLCNTHYAQYRKCSHETNISVEDWLKLPKAPINTRASIKVSVCIIEGCGGEGKAKGLCGKHYKQYTDAKKKRPLSIEEWLLVDKTPPPVKTCTFDGCDKIVAAKNLCANHYYQHQNADRKKPISVKDWIALDRTPIESICTVDGCKDITTAKGLCQTHYMRFKRHGHLKSTRNEDWGQREKHPLYGDWCSMRKTYGVQLCNEWADFWVFVKDIGMKPEIGCWVSLIDSKKKMGPGNFYWEKFDKTGESKISKVEIKAYLKDLRIKEAKNTHSYKRNTRLKTQYGITLDDWEIMYTEQGGVCKICGKAETAINHKTKVLLSLSVDHCHDTGKVRGLLCSNCNRAIGGLRHNVDLLQKALDYCRTD